MGIPFYVNHAQTDRASSAASRRRQLRADLAGTRRSPRSRPSSARSGSGIRPARSASSASAGKANHMDAPYGLGWLRALGSKRWFNAFAQEKTQHNLIDQWMFDASPATFFHAGHEARAVPARPRHQPTHLAIAATTPPRASRASSRTRANRMVVVDPRETETTRGAASPPARAARAPTATCCSAWRR